jgi:hypothetical protein
MDRIIQMLLSVAASGLKSMLDRGFDGKQVAAVLELPVHVRLVTMVPLDVPIREGEKPPRVKIEGLIH